jgi:two-component system, NarL family, sensor histidine kinase UhpB
MKPHADTVDSRVEVISVEASRIADIATIPEKNPNPIVRVSSDGCLQYANPASQPLLKQWGVAGPGAALPEPWRERARAALSHGAARVWEAKLGDRILRLNFVPVVAGQYISIYGADETELRRARDEAERRAAAQTAYNANLLAHLNDAVIATDLGGCVTAWNRAAERLFRWPESEVIGRPIAEILPTQFVTAPVEEVLDRLNNQGEWRGELIITARDGHQVHVEATAVVLRDQDGQPIGQVGVNRDITERKAAEAQNARLVAELNASREQLTALSRRLVAMHEAERSYVADQLYNQAGQVLAALQMQLARLGRGSTGNQLSLVHATLNEAIGELHALASQLRPYTLDRSTLASALRSYLAEYAGRRELLVRFDAGNAENARPPADIATSIFRSLQEGLVNVARHASASEIAVTMRLDGDTLRVTLADNGVGFDPHGAALAGGLGLASIRERMKTVGGHLAVESGPSGSTLTLSAPVYRGADAV